MKEQGTRQEHEPLLCKGIDRAYAEPLHNSNNAWQYIRGVMSELALSISNLLPSHTSVADLPDNSPFLLYLNTLKDTLKLSRLVKKLTQWFKDGRKGSFSYRFTGKETKVFCNKFMFVIQ